MCTIEITSIILTSLVDVVQLLQLVTLVEAKHYLELLNTNLVSFEMYLVW